MFHLLKDLTPTYTWPVKAAVPANGGQVALIKFDAEFKRLESERIRKLLDQENESRPKTDAGLVDEILAGIKAKDESGVYGDVSVADAAELRAVGGIEKAIVLAYYASLSGEKAKN